MMIMHDNDDKGNKVDNYDDCERAIVTLEYDNVEHGFVDVKE